MKKILVPIDGSASSEKAAKESVVLAKKFSSDITFLNVVELTNDALGTDIGSGYTENYLALVDSLMKIKKECALSTLDAAIRSLDLSGLKTEKKVVIGAAHPKIVEIAEEGKYDLIVMGHRGLNPIKRLFLGSVAKRVIEDASCSVLIVK